ncbi:MAG: hypothetical protein KAI39_05155 [Desulfobulbaceae bacterium]|nr:hypothetical protein [Desulfobulbaceae bacterium]
MKILISDTFGPGFEEKLQVFGDVTTDKEQLSEAEVVLIRSKTKCTREYIDNAPNLRLIIRGGVGIDNIDTSYAVTRNIKVNNTPHASSIAVAELTFALMLAIPSRIVEGNQSMSEGKWIKKQLKRTELYGKTLCLVGMGNIAIEVAKRAAAFGMKVVAYRHSGKPSEFAEVKSTLQEAVKDADFVSLHTPLTDSTRGMMNKSVFAVMKKNAVVLNTGRGDCVDAGDVAAALENGDLKAYGTDVWPSDPPPEDYPLLKAPNVLMLPHLGASSVENLGRIEEEIISILKNHVGVEV